MANIFGLGQKAAKDQKEKNFAQLCEANNNIACDIAHLQSLAEVFEKFPGWEAFRKEYIEGVRLPKLYAVAAKALAGDEKTRHQLAGQIAEAEFLAQTVSSIKEKLVRLTSHQKEVQGMMMLHDSHNTGRK